MFLSESNYKYSKVNGNVDAYDGLEIVLEADKAWNHLSMSMIKLEHTAIINEDQALLESGIKAFAEKSIAFFKNMFEKIKDFITKAKAKMLEFATKISSVERKLKEYNPANDGDELNIDPRVFRKTNELVEFINASKDITSVELDSKNKEISAITGEQKIKMSSQLHAEAIDFLFGTRNEAIKRLDNMVKEARKIRNDGIKAGRELIKEADNHSEKGMVKDQIQKAKDDLTKVQKASSVAIRHINKATVDCFTIAKRGSKVTIKEKVKKGEEKVKTESSYLNFFS